MLDFIRLRLDNFSNSFSDVRSNHWARVPIETMKENGIMLGRSDGSFGPDEPDHKAPNGGSNLSTDRKRIWEIMLF